MFLEEKKTHISTLTASLVLYKQDIKVLKQTINCFLKTRISKKLYIIDNSPTKLKEIFINDKAIEYIFIGKNIGFGKGHNLILSKINSDFHLILNPDVNFNSSVIPSLIEQLKRKKNVSLITPKVMYPNGEHQIICRRNPTILSLLKRKLKLKDEYPSIMIEESFYPEFIHGCFMLFKTKDLQEIKGFDERYFLYLEDADICRELQVRKKKIMYFPDVSIEHDHQRASSKNIKLFFNHLSSAIKYFLKWGFR